MEIISSDPDLEVKNHIDKIKIISVGIQTFFIFIIFNILFFYWYLPSKTPRRAFKLAS